MSRNGILIEITVKSSSMDVSTTKAQSGEDSLTTEEKKARNEARASYFSTLG
jgi:hypothetical protein